MEVDSNGHGPAGGDWPNRWSHLSQVLTRKGPFSHPNFQAGPETLSLVRDMVRLCVIGAGGLGCELLKNLAYMGFRNMHVIDMDTIDVSNLNRQFLFRPNDVGKYKAEVAADFINRRIPGANVKAHNGMIQDFDEDFYRQFHVIICGLDSIVARRWINGMVLSLVNPGEDGQPPTGVIPIIDGGTEGFKGHARVILPGMTACIECTLDLYPPQVNFPLCTIAHTPRLPEHCIEYARILLWPKENPFGGEDTSIDGDDPNHISWIYEKALERANHYHITGVTHRLTQGVVKRIIPAVASTNAVIAAVCAMETFKLTTSCADPLNNYMMFNDSEGIYSYAYEAEKNEKCLACSRRTQTLNFGKTKKLQDLIEYLVNQASFQMKNPGLTTIIEGKNKTLYMPNVASIEAATRQNLKKSLDELGLTSGCELVVADSTSPRPLIVKLNLED